MASLKSVPAGPPPGSTGPPDVATPTPATGNEQTIANKVKSSAEKQTKLKFSQFNAVSYIKQGSTYLIRVNVGDQFIDILADYKMNRASLKAPPQLGKGANDSMSF